MPVEAIDATGSNLHREISRQGDHWSFARRAPDVAARRRSGPYGPPCERGGDGRVRVQDQGLRALEELMKRSEGGSWPDLPICRPVATATPLFSCRRLQEAHMLDFNFFNRFFFYFEAHTFWPCLFPGTICARKL